MVPLCEKMSLNVLAYIFLEKQSSKQELMLMFYLEDVILGQ